MLERERENKSVEIEELTRINKQVVGQLQYEIGYLKKELEKQFEKEYQF